MNLLIVDDDLSTLELFEVFLRGKGHNYVTARDGREGLELILSGEFDMVFLDLSMPELSGLEVIREIRTKKLNVVTVMITAYPSSIEKIARQTGADEYLSKPLNWNDINAIIEKHRKD